MENLQFDSSDQSINERYKKKNCYGKPLTNNYGVLTRLDLDTIILT